MEKYTIQKIKELSNFIIDNRSDDEIKNAITKLNIAKSSQDFRGFLLKLIKQNYEDKNPNTLITIEDYVLYLFPDGTFWKDTRDLLLIAIYQKLHEIQKKLDVPSEENQENED